MRLVNAVLAAKMWEMRLCTCEKAGGCGGGDDNDKSRPVTTMMMTIMGLL
jgi:hypothetical protein